MCVYEYGILEGSAYSRAVLQWLPVDAKAKTLHHSIMLELLTLFPRRPLAISIASWILFFVLQIAFLSFAAWERYTPPPEPTYLDRAWFVYTELPKAVPMATVYAVCMVFVAQVFGWFISRHNPDNLTIGQWWELRRKCPVKAAKWISLRLISLVALAGLFVGFAAPVQSLLGTLLGLLIIPLMFDPWLKWFVQGMTSQSEETLRQDGL